MSGAADTGPAPAGSGAEAPDATRAASAAPAGGFSFWVLLQLAVIRSMVSAELASTAIRLEFASSGGARGAHQV